MPTIAYPVYLFFGCLFSWAGCLFGKVSALVLLLNLSCKEQLSPLGGFGNRLCRASAWFTCWLL